MRIDLDISEAKAALEAAAGRLGTERVMPVALRALENHVRKYYRDRGGVFWPRMGKAWVPETAGDVAKVSVEGEWGAILQHKITGGTIRAANAKNLAIPANEQARKKGAPRNFKSPKLRVIRFGRNGPKALVKDDRKSVGKGKKKRAKPGQGKPRKKPEVWYWLKESVTQKADPGALPPMGPLGAAVRVAVAEYVAKRAGGG